MFGLEKLFANKTDFKKLTSEGAIILDVRTPGEFKEGHIKGAVNVPVDQLRNSLMELKNKNKTVITCCRSGARSAIAVDLLTNAGITAINGGPWQSLFKKIA
jgi:rhodanese-related sulfurtransferase